MNDVGYYVYETRPVVTIPDRGWYKAFSLNRANGEFHPDEPYVAKIMGVTTADIDEVTRDEFIQAVEAERGEWVLQGRIECGPEVKALYEAAAAIARKSSRGLFDLSAEERAEVIALRKRSFAMFEAELAARGRPGMPAGT